MTESNGNRQLQAILFTDVVGYTAITESDEARAVQVREAHRALIKRLAREHGGELVDTTGDESFSVFSSALHAVECALALQAALRDADYQVRAGIHLGDVLRRNGEVIGEGVNVAARIRPLADPGGICISEPVYQMVHSHGHVSARPMGAKTLKNVGEPVKVYALTPADPQASAKRRGKFSRGLWIGALMFCVATGMLWANRTAVLTWMALNVPRVMGGSVEQQIGFTETRDGVRIAYATSGSGKPLLFVLGWATHLTEGLGSPLYDQSGNLARYAEQYQVVRYDGRGFGLSDRNIQDFSLDARVRDIEAVVDALGLDDFVLYALSAGGPAAVEYAVRHPQRVSHMILAATWVTPAPNPAHTQSFRGMIQFIATSWESAAARAALVQFLAPEANDVEREVLMHFLGLSGNGLQISRFLETGLTEDLSDRAREVRVPTLVIASHADRTVPLERSRHMAALIPGARFETLQDATHIEASGRHPQVVEWVLEFIR